MKALSTRLILPALLLLTCASGCSRGREAAAATEVVVQPVSGALPLDPLDAAWQRVPELHAPLILQDMVEPRLLAVSTRAVRVRAACDGARVAFRLEWDDATNDDLPMPARFADACAVQLPTRVAPDVPAPQMGEPGRPVEITYWRAAWQATVDGRGDTLRDIHPNASVDHYPFQAASLQKGSEAQRQMEQRYAPARALGNHMAGPRDQPVEDLVSEGPGTLRPAASATSVGRGRRTATGWAVVLARSLPTGLAPGQRTQVALAVWEGTNEEVGSRKMRTGWVPLKFEVRP